MAWSDGTPWTAHHDLERDPRLARAACSRRGRRVPRVRQGGDAGRAMILDAASQQPSRTALTRLAVRRHLAGIPHAAARGAGAARPTCCAATSPTTRSPARPPWPDRWCGVSARSCPAPGSARSATRCATSPASADRSVAAARCRRPCSPPIVAAGGKLLTGRRVTRIRCDGDAVRGVTLDDGTEFDAPVVVSACDPHRHVPRVAGRPAAGGAIDGRALAPHRRRGRLRVEDRRRPQRAAGDEGDRRADRHDGHGRARHWPRSTAASTRCRRDGCSIVRRCCSTSRPCSIRRWRRPITPTITC